MRNNKALLLLLVAIALLLALNLAKELAGPTSLVPTAQAQTIDRVYLVSGDTYFITTDTTGQRVYLYYFERRGSKEDSKLYYINTAEASERHRLK